MASNDPDFFLDKKWKPPKRVIETKTSSSLSRSSSLKGSSSKGQSLFRSFSQKNNHPVPSIPKPSSSSSSLSRSSSITRTSSPPLRRSMSVKNIGSPPKSPTAIRSLSQKSTEFTRKCTTLAKEQRARFYIMKRCVAMLVCWRKEDDS